MPPRNMNPLPGKMPNGQDKEEYTRKCHELIESQYKKLVKIARYETRGDEIWAQELLQDTLLLLLEGYHNVDFTKSPMMYVQIMMRHVKGRHKQLKQKNFNRTALVAYDPRSPTIEKYLEEERKQTDIEFLLEHFHELRSGLTAKQMQIIEYYLDGRPQLEVAKTFNVSKTRVGQILLEVKKKLRKKGLILLQDGSSNDRVL